MLLGALLDRMASAAAAVRVLFAGGSSSSSSLSSSSSSSSSSSPASEHHWHVLALKYFDTGDRSAMHASFRSTSAAIALSREEHAWQHVRWHSAPSALLPLGAAAGVRLGCFFGSAQQTRFEHPATHSCTTRGSVKLQRLRSLLNFHQSENFGVSRGALAEICRLPPFDAANSAGHAV